MSATDVVCWITLSWSLKFITLSDGHRLDGLTKNLVIFVSGVLVEKAPNGFHV